MIKELTSPTESRQCRTCNQEKQLKDFRFMDGCRYNRQCKKCESTECMAKRNTPKALARKEEKAAEIANNKILYAEELKTATKECLRCKEIKHITLFMKAYKNQGCRFGYRSICLECSKDNQTREGEFYKNRKAEANYITLHKNDDLVAERLKEGCVKCGYKLLPALDFDHINPYEKENTVSYFRKKGTREQLVNEMNKCQILCGNCHREKSLKEQVIQNNKPCEVCNINGCRGCNKVFVCKIKDDPIFMGAVTKRCGRCKCEKLVTNYSKNKSEKDGLQTSCKICQNELGFIRRQNINYKEVRKLSDDKRYAERDKFINHRQSFGCIDCGIKNIDLLEFDHITDDKFNGIANLRRAPKSFTIDKFIAELDKCEVRCCNCHRLKTATRPNNKILGTWHFRFMDDNGLTEMGLSKEHPIVKSVLNRKIE